MDLWKGINRAMDLDLNRAFKVDMHVSNHRLTGLWTWIHRIKDVVLHVYGRGSACLWTCLCRAMDIEP